MYLLLTENCFIEYLTEFSLREADESTIFISFYTITSFYLSHYKKRKLQKKKCHLLYILLKTI